MERYLDNYVPCDKRQCVDKEEDDLPNVEVNAVVYAYCHNVPGCPRTDDVPLYDSAIHGAPVYVGQTVQDITARDKHHLSGTATPFDKHYSNPTQYTLVVLCRRTFAPATTPSAFRDDTLRPAAEWMDFKEAHFISHFNTYHNGWNSTQGGQGRAWLVAMREARAKASAKRFETKYMPVFRAFHLETGHINVPKSHPVVGNLVKSIRSGYTTIPPQYEDELMGMGLDLRNQKIVKRDEQWETKYMPAFRAVHLETGHINVPKSHPVVGMLVSSIRSGHTAIPPQYEDELMGMGLDLRNQCIVARDEIWETKYMPAFREFYKYKKHINVPQSYPVIGMLVRSIRSGHTAIPPQYEDELMGMGLDVRNQQIVARDEIWETKYMPAFREFYKDNKHANVPQSYPVIGMLVNNIRHGRTAVPPQYEDELMGMGLDLRNQQIVARDEIWETKYMPAFREFYKYKKHINVPQSYPVIGMLVSSIRSGKTAVPPQYEEVFKEWGFFWCTQNLARHVSRMLGHTVVSLDDDEAAKHAVASAAVHHATLRTLRSTLTKEERKVSNLTKIPLGNNTIGDGVARFYEDAASTKVEGEE